MRSSSKIFTFSVGAFLLISLPGCVATTDMSNRAVDYNQIAADAADTQLLLNIARASERNPTHYTAISQLRDARSVGGSAGVSGSFPFGSDASNEFALTPSLSLTGSQSPSFDVAPLNTKAAARGLFRPVEPDTFVNYWQQSWPRNVLLSMFVDSITLNKSAFLMCKLKLEKDIKIYKGAYIIDNAAYKEGVFRRAQDVFDCIRNKIQVVQKENVDTLISGISIPAGDLVKALPELSKEGFEVSRAVKTGGAYTVRKKSNKWSLVLNMDGRFTDVPVSQNRGVLPAGSEPSISLTMRSVDGMVFYLGELVDKYRTRQFSSKVKYGYGEAPLFQLSGNDVEIRNRIHVVYLGKNYSISRERPGRDEDATLTTFSLLSQLFSQYRESDELPKTQAVQVVGSR